MSKIYNYIILVLILVLFNSCTKQATRPKLTYKLNVSLDLYDNSVDTKNLSELIVITYTDKSGNEFQYTEKEIMLGEKIIVPDGADVKIILNPVNDTDFTYVGVNINEDFDNSVREYNFKMNSDKNVDIVFSRDEIEIFEFTFESEENGYIEISKLKTGNLSAEKLLIDYENSKTIKILNTQFPNHTITAEAIADRGYMFDGWTVYITDASRFITISDDMNKNTIKATFKKEKMIDITFEAGVGGSINIVIENNSTKEIDNTIKIPTGTTTISIPESRFTTEYTIIATAVGESGYSFDSWSIANGIDNEVNNFNVIMGYENKTFKAIFNSQATSPITFDVQTGGYIDVIVTRLSDSKILGTIPITSKTLSTIQIADTSFDKTYYKIEAIVTTEIRYLFKDWSGTGILETKTTLAIDSTMKNKTIKVSFNEETIPFVFEAAAGGHLEVTIRKDNVPLSPTIVTSTGGVQTINIPKNRFYEGTDSGVSVKAIASNASPNFYNFKNWSALTDVSAITSTTLEVHKEMSSSATAIKASFDEQTIPFKFEAGAGGHLEVTVTKKGNASTPIKIDSTTLVANQTINIPKNRFYETTAPASSVSVKAIASNASPNFYTFKNWSGPTGASSEPTSTLTVLETMKGATAIKANFDEETLPFKFEAGAGGHLEVTIRKDNVPLSPTIVTSTGGVQTINIPKNRFYEGIDSGVSVKAIASNNAPNFYTFKNWSGPTADVTGTSGNIVTLKENMKGATAIKANFDEETIPFKFASGKNGSMVVTVTRNGGTTETKTINNSDGEQTITVVRNILHEGAASGVKAVATGITGYNFDIWSGGSTANTPTLTIADTTTMKNNVITANFKWDGVTGINPGAAVGGFVNISAPEHLRWLSDAVNNNNPPSAKIGKYKFANDIDYLGYTYIPIGGTYVGGFQQAFQGEIDGASFSLKNAVYGVIIGGSDAYSAFIGYMQNGFVYNLTIDSSVAINITGTIPINGVVVGSIVAKGNGTIARCVNNANITVPSKFVAVGGIVGEFYGTINNVYNSGRINMASSSAAIQKGVGGIIGKYSSSLGLLLQNAYNTGNIDNAYDAGGIIGSIYNNGINIKNVYSTASITPESIDDKDSCGGVIGVASSSPTLLKNVHFVNKNSLPINGYANSSTIKDAIDKTITAANLYTLTDTFNTETSGVWITATIGGVSRPVLVGIGEGK